ncbi:unnamed protein product, partial [marine sediment metagenome]
MIKEDQQNETLELINKRKTIRAYSKKELTQEKINTIIHGASNPFYPPIWK